MSEDRVVKYIGEGVFSLPPVPMRDLTMEEYKEHRETIEACPRKLYELPKDGKAKKKEVSE